MTKPCKPGRIVHELTADPFPSYSRPVTETPITKRPEPEVAQPAKPVVQPAPQAPEPDLSQPPLQISEAEAVEATTETPPLAVVVSPPINLTTKTTEPYMTPTQALAVKSDAPTAQTGTVAPEVQPYAPCCIDYTFAIVLAALIIGAAIAGATWIATRRKRDA